MHMTIYLFIYLSVYLSNYLSIYLSILDFDTRKNMHNQNGAVLTYYKSSVSVLVSNLVAEL